MIIKLLSDPGNKSELLDEDEMWNLSTKSIRLSLPV